MGVPWTWGDKSSKSFFDTIELDNGCKIIAGPKGLLEFTIVRDGSVYVVEDDQKNEIFHRVNGKWQLIMSKEFTYNKDEIDDLLSQKQNTLAPPANEFGVESNATSVSISGPMPDHCFAQKFSILVSYKKHTANEGEFQETELTVFRKKAGGFVFWKNVFGSSDEDSLVSFAINETNGSVTYDSGDLSDREKDGWYFVQNYSKLWS